MAVEKLAPVESVQTDMNEHTVTVAFDDDDLSVDRIVQALNDAGYTVPGYSKVD